MIKLSPAGSNELKENSAHCELQKSVHNLTHRIAQNYKLHVCICQNKWENGVYCWWPHQSTHWEMDLKVKQALQDQLLVCTCLQWENSLQSWIKFVGGSVVVQIISTWAEDPSIQNLNLFNFYIHLWSSKAKNLSLSLIFTDEQSLDFGSPALSKIYEWVDLVLRHLKRSSNIYIKAFSRASLPKLNSLTGWRPGVGKKYPSVMDINCH